MTEDKELVARIRAMIEAKGINYDDFIELFDAIATEYDNRFGQWRESKLEGRAVYDFFVKGDVFNP